MLCNLFGNQLCVDIEGLGLDMDIIERKFEPPSSVSSNKSTQAGILQ